MIVQRKTHVQLRKEYKKILYLYEAMNRTFVFLGSSGVMRECIVHVDKEGRQKFCHYFERPVNSLIMMNEFEAVVLETRANVISILDLNTHQFKRIPHYFMAPESDQSLLWSFPETKYMAVIEHGRVNNCRFKITYFNYPQKNPPIIQGKPLIYHRKEVFEKQFYAEEGEWTFEHQIVKANNHSMVLWFKARPDEAFEFRFYRKNRFFHYEESNNVDKQNGWQYKSIIIGHKLQEFYNFNKLQLSLLDVFQLQTDKLFVSCLSNRDSPKEENEPITNTYVVNLEARTVVQTPHNLGKYHMNQIDHKLLGSCHMIRTYYYKNGEVHETPVVYFSNRNFQPIFEQSWKCTYRTKYEFPGYDSYTMLENQYENGGTICEFTCRYKKLIEYKEILMFFMLEINENFDDDLMQDVIELIDGRQ